MARGSLYETQHWLRRAYKGSLLSEQQVASLTPIIGELSPKLNAYFRSVNTVALANRKQSTKRKVQSSKA
jgi:four helix bundle protein